MNTNNNVMVDLETLGTRPGSVIKALGAVAFNKEHGIYDSFYETIDVQSCLDVGLTTDWNTIEWWLKQSDEARLEMVKPGIPLKSAINNFNIWMQKHRSGLAGVWGNGAAFDNSLISVVYNKIDYRQPWKYSEDRCYRTMRNMFPAITHERTGTHHNALDDARYQAEHLIKILNHIDERIA